MLKIIKSMCELNTEQLMAVYTQSNRENGQQRWPDLPAEKQLQRAEDDFLFYLREDFFRQSGAIYAVWTSQAVYQSALRLEPYRDGLLLEALETAPNARRNGYAFSLLSQTLDYLRTTDCKVVYSHVNKRNKASLGVHEKCGFHRIADTAVYIDGTVTQNSCTLCCRLKWCIKNSEMPTHFGIFVS